MAYVAVEADERLEEGPQGLQFKSFLGDTASNTRPGSAGVSNVDRGYLSDQPQRKSNGGFWTVEYYQVYFEVDTKEVLRRCYSTLLPTSTNYFSTHLNPPDLYGPFWTLTTLIFTLFLSSSLAASISAYLSSADQEYDYDFGLLSLAMGIVYAYGLGLPILLWLALRYMGVGEWSMVDAVAIWGYALFVWIPVSILCVIPVPLFRWVLVFLAFASSGYFLVRNVYPILASAEAKATRLLIIVIAVLHAGLALVFKVLFFGYYVVDKIGMDLPLPGGDDPGGAVKMLF
ncbi:Yip1-domain-containing protein [Gymnopus androsaceus JB14]|uniref:Protein YIP n=1 Tax=Gymnopus androsaceus JB14 TaxID=1447944 RepID=A0A6A4HTV9_9AGAR|nr:Yip1-domain-containing protein [Gymnopus androsaceus JB14]